MSSSWRAAVALLLPGSRGPGHSSWCSSWLRPGLGTRCPPPPRALRGLQGREFLLRRKLLNLRSSFTRFHFLFQQLQARRLPQSPAHGALRAHVGKKAQPSAVVWCGVMEPPLPRCACQRACLLPHPPKLGIKEMHEKS